MPIFRHIGPVVVNSETARIKVEYDDPGALECAVKSLGGTWIGMGKHDLFSSEETGFGFKLPKWRYPIVLSVGGELHYDDYHGSWGNVQDLEKLKGQYAIALAETQAQNLGWLTERTIEGQLTIFHPNGGTINIQSDGSIERCGVNGSGCHQDLADLGLQLEDVHAKPEYGAVAASVQRTS